MKRSRQRSIFRTLIIFVSIFAFLLGGSLWLVNSKTALQTLLQFINRQSEWKIDMKAMTWIPWQRRMTCEGIVIAHPQKQQKIEIQNMKLGYHFFALLRGKIWIDHTLIENVTISFPKQETKKEKKKKFEFQKLFLLQNMKISNTRVVNTTVSVGKQSEFHIDEINLAFERTLIGESTLEIGVKNTSIASGIRSIASAETIDINAKTKLKNLMSTFPYLNDLQGEVKASHLSLEGTNIEKMMARVNYSDAHLTLSPFSLDIGKNILEGKGDLQFDDETFSLEFSIPQPITVPHIIKPTTVMDTGGALSGKILLTGEKFSLSESSGEGVVDIAHRFSVSPDRLNQVTTKILWNAGVITCSDGRLKSGESESSFHGTIDVKKKQMSFEAKGEAFPLEYVFEQFRDPHLKLLFGKTDFEGTFQGWGKNFQTHIKGKVHNGGWKPITAEEINAVFEATYDELSVTGTISQHGKQTGEADFRLLYGSKKEGQPRSKSLVLKASIENYDLGASLETPYGFSGRGSGNLELSGPISSFKGNARVQATDGHWYAFAYDSLSTMLTLSKQKIVFSGITLKPPNLQQEIFPDTLTMDLAKNTLRLYGKPTPTFHIDLSRTHASGTWTLHNVSYTSPLKEEEKIVLNGSLYKEGKLDVRIKGKVDLEKLNLLSSYFREIDGGSTVDMRFQGTFAEPLLFGTLTFHDAFVSPRDFRLPMENLTGTLELSGKKIEAKNINASVDGGTFTLNGNITHRDATLEEANLSFICQSLTVRLEGSDLRLTLDGDVTLQGRFPSPLLKGTLTILDGRYRKNFRLIDSIQEKDNTENKQESNIAHFNPLLKLRVRNTGDVLIRNNIGDIDLHVDLEIQGTREKPTIHGSVDILSGHVRYLGLNFEITKGFVEFREPYATPYLEITAERDIGVYRVKLVLRGETENLSYDFSETSPPLAKKDVISLIAFGVTEEERRREPRDAAQEQFASKVISSQVSSVLQGPVSELTHLDVFRLEAADPSSRAFSRVYLGKQINDRLSIDFSTDVKSENALQTITAVYALTDYLFLKGNRSSNQEFGTQITLRFRSR